MAPVAPKASRSLSAWQRQIAARNLHAVGVLTLRTRQRARSLIKR